MPTDYDLRNERIHEYVAGSGLDVWKDCNVPETPSRYLVVEKCDGNYIWAYSCETLDECAREIDASTTEASDVVILDLDSEGEDAVLSVVRTVARIMGKGVDLEYASGATHTPTIVTISGGVGECVQGGPVSILDLDSLRTSLDDGDSVILDDAERAYLEKYDADFLADLDALNEASDDRNRLKELRKDRDSYVLGHPDGRETPNPRGWARDNPEDAAELRRLEKHLAVLRTKYKDRPLSHA